MAPPHGDRKRKRDNRFCKPWNPRPSVFIRGSLLHGYGQANVCTNRQSQIVEYEQLTEYASFHGPFLPQKEGHFAENQGSHGNYFALFFVFFRFFGIFPVATHCLSTTSADPTPPKKIMPKTLP
jgi:hypothetical protein